MEQLTVVERGGIYPNAQPFTKASRWFKWDGMPKRPPKKGEWYLSGAFVEAYQAPNDLSTAFHIAIPVELVPCPTCGGWGKVEA